MSGKRRKRQNVDLPSTIRLFREAVKKLREHPFTETKDLSLKINYDFTTNTATTIANEPTDVVVESFLVNIRKLLLNNDPTYIFHVYNLCQANITNDTYKTYLNKALNIWRNSCKTDGFPFIYNGKNITQEYLFNLYLNGIIFHNDIDKLNEFNLLARPPMDKLLKFKFLGFLFDTLNFIVYVDDIIAASLKENSMHIE